MNRKTYAIEEKFRSQSSRVGKKAYAQQQMEQHRLDKIIQETRPLTEQDIVNELRECKEFALTDRAKFSFPIYPWEKEMNDIIRFVYKECEKHCINIKRFDISTEEWYSLLESYAVSEFRKRSSPLYKLL